MDRTRPAAVVVGNPFRGVAPILAALASLHLGISSGCSRVAPRSGTPTVADMSVLRCVPGDVKSCPCLGGPSGVQRCADAGDRWEACQCLSVADGSAAPVDAGSAAVDATVLPTGALGDPCLRSTDCASSLCLALSVAGAPRQVCAVPCCNELECPSGFGCLQLGAGRYCLPARIYPAGYTFGAATGASCGAGGNQCKSGICDAAIDRCRGTCCTDAECVSAPCHWSLTGSTLRTFCDPRALILGGVGRTGDACQSENDCWSGVCAENPTAGRYDCADLCCSSAQCLSGTACGLVAGVGGAVVRACVATPTGPGADGSPCSDDGESCEGGMCVGGECRRLCCLDLDCPAGGRCLPRLTKEGVLAPVCLY